MIRRIDDHFAVAPQISPIEVGAIAQAGYAEIVNNRPDDEEPGQPSGSEIARASEAAGIAYRAIPVSHAGFSGNQVEAMASALTAAGGPVLAFCRSGTRSAHLWGLARARMGDEPATIVAKAAAAGYDLSGIRAMLDTLAAARAGVSWLQLGGSLAAILALAGIARLLKLGESRISDPARACAIAEELLAGFVARRALVSGDGSAALVAGNGTVAVLKRHGARVAARRVVPPLRPREAVEGVTVDTGERLFGPATLTGVIADEVNALADLARFAETVH